MGYTAAQMDAATAALVAAVHGLHPDVARAWATAEQGVGYNILGVTYRDATGQHLFRYGSFAQGAEAAAHLIAYGPYAGIRAALVAGTSADQAAAIIASPWNRPYYSSGAGAAGLRAIAARGDTPTPTAPYLLHIAPRARIEAVPVNSAYQITGDPLVTVWGARASSAPCSAPRYLSGVHSGGALCVFVPAGAFAGRWVHAASAGVTVTKG